MRVLLVEDAQGMRKLISTMLQGMGFKDVMYRKYKGPFRGAGQAIWASDRPLCSRVCAFTRPLF
jgi:CheY-like chemotaxis protein